MGKHECLFKKAITVEQLFVGCLDIFGKPSRGFYEQLYKYCSDPADKAKAKTILSADNKEEMKKWADAWDKSMTYFSVMKEFKSCKPTLMQMLDIVNLIKPRYYSIASSQKYVGPTNLHLGVGVVDWTDSSGTLHYGETTGMFSRFGTDMRKSGGKKRVCAAIKATAFHLPDTEEKPVIVAGMGTGLVHLGLLCSIKHGYVISRSLVDLCLYTSVAASELEIICMVTRWKNTLNKELLLT